MTPEVSRVAVGADHGGFSLKQRVLVWARELGCEVADLGTHSEESCDYPQIARKVASAVSRGEFERGILICRSGVGMAIAANKFPGVRAGVCSDEHDARHSREHNDTNILVIGADKLGPRKAKALVKAWFAADFDPQSRHARRVNQIREIEREVLRHGEG